MWDQRNSGMRNMVERGPDTLPSLLGPEVPPPPADAAADDWVLSCTTTCGGFVSYKISL